MGSYDQTKPAPRAITAENIGGTGEPGLVNISISYDRGDPTARLISAYFLANGAAATQNIEPVADGAGTAIVPIGEGVDTVMLRHMYGTLPGDGSDIVWGPFGNEIPVTTAAVPVSDKPGKSQEKGNPTKP